MLRDGLTQDAVMVRLGISHNTVNHHVRDIHERLGVATTIEAVWAMRRELGGCD